MSSSSASFEALQSTALGATGLLVVAFITYGIALRFQSVIIKPRCTARPRNVIYNGDKNAWIGWIRSVFDLRYETMINGVPRTGTKKNGEEGTLLKVNLDGIIFLRFNALCFRVAVLTTILTIGIILPVNWTADPNYNQSTYSRTTLANIPTLSEIYPNVTVSDVSKPRLLMRNLGINLNADLPLQFRLYTIVFCFWIVTYYLCVELGNEWYDNLELRRIYYLEADHHNTSKAWIRREEESHRTSDEGTKKRDVWIPNPDHPATVPNIGLYSLIVTRIPSIPDETLENETAQYIDQQLIDWQLSVTEAFFDRCCPNQPGFSSSVAAITILPGARQLSTAWGRWYRAAAALRRLRYIRSLIADRLTEKYLHGQVNELHHEHPCLQHAHGRRNIFKENNAISTRELVSQISSFSMEERASQVEELKNEIELQLLEALECGPEQTAAYEREYALAASGCAPNGWGSIRTQSLEDLIDMEKDALDTVKEANEVLRQLHSELITRGGSVDSSHDIHESSFSIEMSNKEKKDFFLTESVGKGGGNVVNKSSQSLNYKSSVTSRKLNHDKSSLAEQSLTSTVPRSRTKQHTNKKGRQLSARSTYANEERPNRRSSRFQKEGSWSLRQKCTLNSFRECYRNMFHDRMISAFDEFYRETTCAVVTFTNRQAAVAARQCLADGRGGHDWYEFEDIPIPPLADAPACDLSARNLFRPVTLSLPRQTQVLRSWCKNFLLIVINLFYTVPLTYISTGTNLSNKSLSTVFPESRLAQRSNTSLDGIIYAVLYSLFVSICPYMFQLLAYFGSNANSFSNAELSAMKYYWIFVYITSYTGVTIANSLLAAWASNELAPSLTYLVKAVADTIPVSISFNWTNTIILRTSMTLPWFYLLQLNTYIFKFLRLNCLARCMMGGGAGGNLPYRAYIDAGTTFLCTVNLSFAAPLVAPVTLVYFLVSEAVWRQTLLYVYEPTFDGGGFRWPFISDMCFSSMILAQILLAFMISLKRTIGPAFAAGITVIPTIMFRKNILRQYYREYTDTALLQQSYLDLWEGPGNTTKEEREEFRKFLVDCHKAAYIPVCISSSETTIFTTEPARVIPTDVELERSMQYNESGESWADSGNLFTVRESETSTKSYPSPKISNMTLRRIRESKLPFSL